ncbi:hypothetical protein Y032_0003g1286 [Ancylostoma ceylanicum]|uniref:Uncharacterized protein n=1 Tax=Ancylostoma ceylanicum TaxID=53326 RepID=A0A016VWT8_9BILA|nr:hypothetical protein Y032_0003g1286 [Ancylostoma ceylanicum]
MVKLLLEDGDGPIIPKVHLPPRCVRRSNERNGFRTTLGLSGVLPRRFIEYGLNDLHEKLEIIQNPKGDLTLLRTDSVIRLTPVS